MKRKTLLLSLLCLVGMMSASAQQTWNFTQTPEADVTALKAATTEWTYTEASDRYENNNAISGAIKAGGTELQMTQGLTVEAAAKKVRIDVNKRLQLAGKNIPLNILNLKAGQVVTIEFASTGDAQVTFDVLTNLSGTSGFAAADKNTTQTGTGTVANDGAVSFKCSGGSTNIFKISVSEPSSQGGDDPTAQWHDVPKSTLNNQALLTLKGGDAKYYNTESLLNIDLSGNNVVVNIIGTTAIQDTYDNVEAINFVKKADQGQPGEIVNGSVEITEAKGWQESLYAKWNLLQGAESYAVYAPKGMVGRKGEADVVREAVEVLHAFDIGPARRHLRAEGGACGRRRGSGRRCQHGFEPRSEELLATGIRIHGRLLSGSLQC